MQNNVWNRRAALAALTGLAAGVAGIIPGAYGQAVKWSSGTEPVKMKVPPNATDCHHHVYDARFPVDPKATLRPPDASVADYRSLQKRIGTTRNVIVQPSTYGVDNRLLLEALGQFGITTARGVAVVNTEVTDAELKQLQDAGVRGIRFNLGAQAGATTMEMVDPLSKRVAALGWHIQVNAPGDKIVAAKDLWSRLPCPVVFDHLGHVPQPEGASHPVFGVIRELLQKGTAWVKLSGFYMDGKVGPPTYADRVEVAKAYVKEAPERLVWGSDWPHPTEKEDNKPDDAKLLDLLAACAPDEATRNRILVDNAAKLYGFG
jgi:predicted TIM-barrel fold metal-dependent hydrolase